MFKNKKKKMAFDLFIPLGIACRPAHYLRDMNLRFFSCPLDWMMDYTLGTALELFKNNFDDFFMNIKEDKSYVGLYKKVQDVSNRIISIHHFRPDYDIDTELSIFRKIMLKRYRRLNIFLRKAKNICIVSNRNDTIEILSEFLKEFNNLYPWLKITFINIKNSDNKKIEEFIINDKLSIIHYSFVDVNRNNDASNPGAWVGNEQE